jgi:hypothetical protein
MQLRVAVQFESPAFEALIALRSRLIREILYENAVHTNGTGTWSAAFAKTGAVATAFLFPILLVAIGTRFPLYGLIADFKPGAAVTWGSSRIEIAGSISS